WKKRFEVCAAVPPGKAAEVVLLTLDGLGKCERIAQSVNDLSHPNHLDWRGGAADDDERSAIERVRLARARLTECRLALQRRVAVVVCIVVLRDSSAERRGVRLGIAGAGVRFDLNGRNLDIE